jgi:hypothetical protein
VGRLSVEAIKKNQPEKFPPGSAKSKKGNKLTCWQSKIVKIIFEIFANIK